MAADQWEIIQGRLAGKLLDPSGARWVPVGFLLWQQEQEGPWE